VESEKLWKLFSLRSKSIFIKNENFRAYGEEIVHNFPLSTFHFTLQRYEGET